MVSRTRGPGRIRKALVLAVTAFLIGTMGVSTQLASAEPVVGEGFTVDVQHTGAKDPGTYVVGDRLGFSFTVSSQMTETRGIELRETNLTNASG